jgi:ParB/RepB/Spo0J family partition protein
MSTTQVPAPPTGQLRTIALSEIAAIESWNPRLAIDDAELRALAASMRERGCLQPIRVQATDGGHYRVIAGERRYKAAVLAQLTELPAIVRVADAEETPEVRDAELLIDAVVENQLRAPLSPVEEALACRRLKTDHGLTVKGIAQKLQMTQARVRERLAILELPEELWPRVGSGEIPTAAVSALVALGKIHAGLPQLAVTLVLDRGDVYDAEPWTWRDVANEAPSRGRRRPARRDRPGARRRPGRTGRAPPPGSTTAAAGRRPAPRPPATARRTPRSSRRGARRRRAPADRGPAGSRPPAYEDLVRSPSK